MSVLQPVYASVNMRLSTLTREHIKPELSSLIVKLRLRDGKDTFNFQETIFRCYSNLTMSRLDRYKCLPGPRNQFRIKSTGGRLRGNRVELLSTQRFFKVLQPTSGYSLTDVFSLLGICASLFARSCLKLNLFRQRSSSEMPTFFNCRTGDLSDSLGLWKYSKF